MPCGGWGDKEGAAASLCLWPQALAQRSPAVSCRRAFPQPEAVSGCVRLPGRGGDRNPVAWPVEGA